MIYLLGMIWSILGISGFIFWWTTELDYTTDFLTLFITFICGLIGPFSWILGYLIHGAKNPKILIKRRIK
jgi:hypothetical protein